MCGGEEGVAPAVETDRNKLGRPDGPVAWRTLGIAKRSARSAGRQCVGRASTRTSAGIRCSLTSARNVVNPFIQLRTASASAATSMLMSAAVALALLTIESTPRQETTRILNAGICECGLNQRSGRLRGEVRRLEEDKRELERRNAFLAQGHGSPGRDVGGVDDAARSSSQMADPAAFHHRGHCGSRFDLFGGARSVSVCPSACRVSAADCHVWGRLSDLSSDEMAVLPVRV